MKNLKSSQFKIAFLIDNPYRDLPGLALTAWHMCQYGAICYLVPMNLRNEEIWALAPAFVLINHFRTVYEDFVENLMSAGIKVGVLDTEGSVFSPVPKSANSAHEGTENRKNDSMPAFEEYALSMAKDKALRHCISNFCAWTPEFAKYAVKRGWYLEDQITVTGSPRMDFFSSQWQDAALKMSDYADEFKQPIIMINSSFTLANSRFQSPEKEMAMMIEKFSYNRDFMIQWMANQKNALNDLASLANHLARHFPDATFVFRPHPFESIETYDDLLESLPNLHVVKKGTIDGWLLRAKAVIHWGSSTAIEACLAGIPAFSAGWIPEHLPIPAVDEVSIKCFSEKELINKISDVLKDNFKVPAIINKSTNRIIAKTFYKIDGFSHQRIGDAILNTLKANKNQVSVKKCRTLAFGRSGNLFKDIISKGKKNIRRLMGYWKSAKQQPEKIQLDWGSSEKFFDDQQVKEIIKAVQECALAQSDKIKQVHVDTAFKHDDYAFNKKGNNRTVVLHLQ